MGEAPVLARKPFRVSRNEFRKSKTETPPSTQGFFLSQLETRVSKRYCLPWLDSLAGIL